MQRTFTTTLSTLLLATTLLACSQVQAQRSAVSAPSAPAAPPAAPLRATPPAAPEAPEPPDSLKLAAVEALLIAPPKQSLPIVKRLMTSDTHPELKARAMFILSQIDDPEAHQLLLDTARTGEGELQLEAIRMMAVSGNSELIAQLKSVYKEGSPQVREAVLHAYMIADERDAVYQAALDAENEEEFRAAVEVLGMMGATNQLKQLRDHPAADESLLRAYAMAGDTESLLSMARDSSNLQRQVEAIRSLGMANGPGLGEELMDIYRSTDNYTLKQAVMQSLMMTDDDQSVLELFRSASEDREKADLLRLLVMMDSDAAMEAISSALAED